jgi:hypothetical protein
MDLLKSQSLFAALPHNPRADDQMTNEPSFSSAGIHLCFTPASENDNGEIGCLSEEEIQCRR